MQISPSAYITEQVQNVASNSAVSTGFGAIFDAVQKTSAQYQEAHDTAVKSTHDNLTAVKDLPINDEDYKAIEKKLEEAGVEKETLKRLKEEVDKESLTWDNLLETLKQTAQINSAPKATELTQDTQNKISSILTQAGLSPNKTSDVLADLEAGNTKRAWETISEALKNLNGNATLSITKDELAALGKGLQLDNNALAKLQSLLSGSEGTMNSSGIKQLTALLDSSVAAQNASGEKLLEEVKQQLNPLIANALENGGKLSAKNRASNEEDATRILRADKATQKGLGFMPSANSKEVATESTTSSTKSGNAGKEATASADAIANASESASTNADADSLLGGKQNNSKSSWMNFFNNTALADGATSGQPSTSPAQNVAGQAVSLKQASTNILEQIQNGVFRSLRNGVNQLSLKLNTADFGPVAVLVSTKSGEVAAKIRTDNPEVAKTLQDNMHTLRASLEAQGLKVEKLDVQTGMQNHLQNNNSWDTPDQHNAQQEAHQRFLAKQQFRQLKDTKQDLVQGTTTIQQASHSSNRVYLVA